MIPEGRSFLEHPEGFICLDCGKVTNQSHKGRTHGRDPTSPSNATSSAQPHPVYLDLVKNFFFIKIILNFQVWS